MTDSQVEVALVRDPAEHGDESLFATGAPSVLFGFLACLLRRGELLARLACWLSPSSCVVIIISRKNPQQVHHLNK